MRGVLLAVLAAFPVLVVLLANRSTGPALSQDSVSYLATARAVIDGGGLTSFDGQPLTLFPPGLPVLLGGLMGLGAPWEAAASAVSAVGIGATVVGTYLLGVITLRSRWWAVLPTAVVSISAPLLEVFTWLWTEPAFTALTVCLLVLLSWGIRHGASPWWLVVGCSALTSVAFSFRYAGLVLVPITLIGIWWASRAMPRRGALGRVVVAMLVSLVLPAVVVMRNLLQGVGPLGERYPGVRTLLDALVESVEVLGAAVLPSSLAPLWVLAGAALLVIATVAGWAALVDRDRVAGLLVLFVVAYLGSLIWSQSATRLDTPSVRLLTPMIPALAVLATSGALVVGRRMARDLEAWSQESPRAGVRRPGARSVGLAVVAVLVLVAGVLTASFVAADVRLARDQGRGAPNLATSRSDSATVLAAWARGAEVLASNDPWSTYLRLGSPTLALPPSAEEWPADRIDRDTARLVETVRSRGAVYALVFDGAANVQPVADLEAAGITVTLVEQADDGAIYLLTPAVQ